MKWMVGSVLALVIGWFFWSQTEQSSEENRVTESSRRVWDVAWRATPEREMTIAEMDRYTAGLSDEELWRELGRVYADWLIENEGREYFSQPRLAVMLAREIGTRGGEAGMMEVARWLENQEPSLEDLMEDSKRMLKQFFGTRIQTASYGGWIANEPEEAISRLIESGRKEEEWPVPNQGFLMYFKTDHYFAIERVLRDGFERLARQDLERAQRLMI